MSNPPLMLGGVAVHHLLAGGAAETQEAIGGSSTFRLSGGAAVKMTHWQKMSGSISGEGFWPPGLDGLDYTQPLELRSTKVRTHQAAGAVITLQGTPRPDHAPWGYAVVGRELVPTPVAMTGKVATLTAVPGATAYQVCWQPVYTVMCNRPSESQAGGSRTWSLAWEEA